MSYDTREAAEILHRARFALSKSARDSSERRRRQAAEELVKTLCEVLGAAGFQVRRQFEPDNAEIGLADVGWVFLTYEDPGFRVEPWDIRTKSPTGYAVQAPITWDPIRSRFTGTAPDEYLVPVPGEPRQKADALSVVAKTIVAVLNARPQGPGDRPPRDGARQPP
jgi:hypothetical protein